jgi:hypothetical protein
VNVDNGIVAGGAPSDVLITEAVAVNLHRHLTEQGRNVGGPQDLALLLNRAVDRAWGTKDAPRFKDDAGGGWIVDLSSWLNGEMLYAQIRTVHGRRTLTTVVETEEYEAFVQTGKWRTPAAANPESALVDEATLAELQAMESEPRAPAAMLPQLGAKAAQPVPAPQEYLEDPMLIIVSEKVKEGDELGIKGWIRCTRAEVPERIQTILRDKDIEMGDIEIWSRMTKPKVTIQF